MRDLPKVPAVLRAGVNCKLYTSFDLMVSDVAEYMDIDLNPTKDKVRVMLLHSTLVNWNENLFTTFLGDSHLLSKYFDAVDIPAKRVLQSVTQFTWGSTLYALHYRNNLHGNDTWLVIGGYEDSTAYDNVESLFLNLRVVAASDGCDRGY